MCKTCKSCNSDRVMNIEAKTCNLAYMHYKGEEFVGQVPGDSNIGKGDYLDIEICLECGQVQGEFPVKDPDMKEYTQLEVVKAG